MSAAVFLAGAGSEDEMAAVFGVGGPFCDQGLVHQLIGGGDDEGVGGEVAIFGDDIDGRHHGLQRAVVLHPVGLGVPAGGLLVILYVPTVVEVDEEGGAAPGVSGGLFRIG